VAWSTPRMYGVLPPKITVNWFGW